MSKRTKLTGKGRSGRFFAMPWSIINDPRFSNLSPKAVKLLIDICAQYDGFNNGHLKATWKHLHGKRGWKSEDSLGKAKKELIANGLIMVTRHGGKNKPTLYAITWLNIDEKPNVRLQVGITFTPPGAWRKPDEYEDARLNVMCC